MRLCTPSSLVALAMCSALVVLPFLPVAKPGSDFFALELRLGTATATVAQLYYDTGAGFNEADSVRRTVTPGSAQTYRFPLPAGTLRALRLDPTDRAGTLVLGGPVRLMARTGRIVHVAALTDIQPQHEISSVRQTKSDEIEIVTTPDAHDPQVTLAIPEVRVAYTLSERLTGLLPRAAPLFLSLAFVLWLVDRNPALLRRVEAARVYAQRRPRLAVSVAAAIGAIASAYPLLFLGKSVVSPNNGTALWYHSYPTLPGNAQTAGAQDNGSDIGAMMYHNVPYARIQGRLLREGALPWWNRYNGGGLPMLGQGQSMFGEPLNFLVIAAGSAAWAWDAKYVVCKCLFALALGWLVLALRDDGEAPGAPTLAAALLTAFAACFIGFFTYRINHPAICTLAYAPWILLCWLRFATAAEPRRIWLSLFGVFLANLLVFLSGTVKEAVLLILQMNLGGLVVLAVSPHPARVRWIKLGLAVVAGGLVLLICAPVWLTFLHTLGSAYTAYTNPAAYQIQPSLLLGAFDELFFRPLTKGEIVFNPSLNLLFLLGVVTFLASLTRMRNRVAPALFGVSLVFAAIVFGVVSPLWITRLPLVGNVAHIENCFLCGLIILWAALGGMGFASVFAEAGTPEMRRRLGVAALLLAAIVGAWIGFWQASHRMVYGPGTTVSVVPAGEVLPVADFVWVNLFLFLAAAIVLAWVGGVAPRARSGGGLILAACAVVVCLWRFGLHGKSIGFDRYTLKPQPRANFGATSPSIDFLQQQQRTRPVRVQGMLNNAMAGWTAMYGLENIGGADALQSRYVHDLLDEAHLRTSGWRLLLLPPDVATARPLLDALNVAYYLDSPANRAVDHAGLTRVKTGDLDIYESGTAWPRAFFSNDIRTHASVASLVEQMLRPDHAPFVSLDAHDAAAAPPRAPAPAWVAATNYRLTSDATEFAIDAPGAGMIALLENYWPDDIEMTVNGRVVPVVRVNHAFRGAVITVPGKYVVVCRYVPRYRGLALSLSAAGLLLSVGLLIIALRFPQRLPGIGASAAPAPV